GRRAPPDPPPASGTTSVSSAPPPRAPSSRIGKCPVCPSALATSRPSDPYAASRHPLPAAAVHDVCTEHTGPPPITAANAALSALLTAPSSPGHEAESVPVTPLTRVSGPNAHRIRSAV